MVVTGACQLPVAPTSPRTPSPHTAPASPWPLWLPQVPAISPERLLQDHALLLQPRLSGLCCLALPSIHHGRGKFYDETQKRLKVGPTLSHPRAHVGYAADKECTRKCWGHFPQGRHLEWQQEAEAPREGVRGLQ